MEASRRIEHDLAGEIARQGWIGATIGPEYGGMGVGHLAKTVIIEELSRVSGAMGAMVQASQLGVAKIMHFGTAEQKKAWLPRIAAGDVPADHRGHRGRAPAATCSAWRAPPYGTATTTSSTAARSTSATATSATCTASSSAPARAPTA